MLSCCIYFLFDYIYELYKFFTIVVLLYFIFTTHFIAMLHIRVCLWVVVGVW